MNTPQKTNALQAYQIILYDRALHPELFPLRRRRVARQGRWELEAWVMQGQHLLRFGRGPICAAELVTDQEAGLPTAGAVAAFLCAGERDFEHAFAPVGGNAGPACGCNGRLNGHANGHSNGHANGHANGPLNGHTNGSGQHAGLGSAIRGASATCPKGGVLYMTTVQTESLSENLYIATVEEMTAHARENQSLVHAWDEEAGRGMSLLDIQKFAAEVHVQAYHLLPAGGVVIRTQSIFEHT